MDLSVTPPVGEYVPVPTEFGPATLHLRQVGKVGAPAAVYLHGLGGSSTNWTDLARLLAPYRRGFAVDLPGFGLSPPPEGFDYTRQAHAGVIVRLLEQLDVGAVELLGNSFGGAVAIEVAASRPDLVSTLTLISPAMPDLRPHPSRLTGQGLSGMLLPVLGRAVRRERVEADPREHAERLLRLCCAEPDAIPAHRIDEAVAEYRESLHLPWSGPALGRTLKGLLRSWLPSRHSLWRRLAEVRAPSLVVWGDQDKVITVRKAPRTARRLAHGRLLILARTGHVAQMERPHLIARASLAMYDELTGERQIPADPSLSGASARQA